jgi:hypothetical protein
MRANMGAAARFVHALRLRVGRQRRLIGAATSRDCHLGLAASSAFTPGNPRKGGTDE